MKYYILNGIAQQFQNAIDTSVFGGVEITQAEYHDVQSGTAWISGNTVEYPQTPSAEELLNRAKDSKRLQIETAYTTECNNIAITISGTTVHYPFVAGNRTWNEAVAIQAAYGALPNATPIQLEFFGKDGSFTFTNAGAWKNFYNLCVAAYGVHGQTRAQRNAQINVATTIAQVESVVW